MPMSDAARAQWQIHLCVLLWGFTAILGKLISLAALPLVWWRMALVTAMLALVPRVWRALRTLSARQITALMGVGVVVALHWLTFYASIKLSNASVAATCMALGSVFTALIEPFAAAVTTCETSSVGSKRFAMAMLAAEARSSPIILSA